jgi:hypothetical protein
VSRTIKGITHETGGRPQLVLTTKVADFTAQFASFKAQLNENNKRDVNFWLVKVQAKKTIVAKLKVELEAVTMTGIPVPESIDDIAASIEHIINCSAKKGTHLATKVEIICECVLTSIFDGCFPGIMSSGGNCM